MRILQARGSATPAVRAAAKLAEALADLNAELERDLGTTLAVRIGNQHRRGR